MFSQPELVAMFTSTRQQDKFRGTQRAFERFLADSSRLVVEPDRSGFSHLPDAYRRHLTEIRGLAPATIDQHLATAASFLAHAVPDGIPLRTLSAPTVEQYVVTVGQRLKRQSLQHTVARLRAFLRFCHDRGDLCERLDCIDTPRAYRDELPPRALTWDIVQALLGSIDLAGRCGLRGHAMLYLMAYYGLRPSEIVGLTLASFDCANRSLRVEQCKTSSQLLLPLPEQACAILERYISSARPHSSHPQLFLRARTPDGPLKHTDICDVYAKHAKLSKLACREARHTACAIRSRCACLTAASASR